MAITKKQLRARTYSIPAKGYDGFDLETVYRSAVSVAGRGQEVTPQAVADRMGAMDVDAIAQALADLATAGRIAVV